MANRRTHPAFPAGASKSADEGDIQPPDPLKPQRLRDAYENAPFHVTLTNMTLKKIHISVEVGDSRAAAPARAALPVTRPSPPRARRWDWLMLFPSCSHKFPSRRKNPYVCCSYSGDKEYFENCKHLPAAADEGTAYCLVPTNAKGAFKYTHKESGEDGAEFLPFDGMGGGIYFD